jgi:hypothetical protein
MDNQSDVRLIYAHAKSDRGHNDIHLVTDKALPGPVCARQAQARHGKGAALKPLRLQVFGHFLGFLAGKTVDDDRFFPVAVSKR